MCPFLQTYGPPGGLDTADQETLACFSGRTPAVNTALLSGLGSSAPGALVSASFPVMLSAVDPVQEAKLVGLPQTLVSGKYLSETQGLLPAVDEQSGR
jgi:hypothetical protein